MSQATRRFRSCAVTALGAALLCLLVAGPAQARELCVAAKKGCHPTLRAALAAAHDGDTIQLAPGRYAGGVTIDKSIRLIGSGSRSTLIVGGGPVLTIGRFLAPSQPSVALSGVTITGGVTTSSPDSEDAVGKAGVLATGGGILISPSTGYGPGATVTIRDSVVSGNRATPTATVPGGPACPGGGNCPFAFARGGGIETWGQLTLTRTTVSDNLAGGIASDAVGGGVSVRDTASLAVIDSVIRSNSAKVSEPNGRFAEGGGIFTDPAVSLSVRGSVVSANAARLQSRLPYFVEGAEPLDMNANGGGIHAGNDSDVSIDRTTIARNTVSVRDPNGQPYAFDSGLMTGTGPLELRNSRIEHNRLYAEVGSTDDAGPSGGAVDIYGPATVVETVIRANETTVSSRTGTAAASAAVYNGEGSETTLIADSFIVGNTVRASSQSGEATIRGAGLFNDGQLKLRDVLIADNSGRATGTAGFAQGGGIFNGRFFNEQGPIELALERTVLTRNRLSGSPGIAVQGGGIFTEVPLSLDGSRVEGNAPDQVVR
jgi:hypothetical protein